MLLWHPAKNDVMAKSNMTAITHDEQLIVFVIYNIHIHTCNTSKSPDLGTLNSFLVWFGQFLIILTFKLQGQCNVVAKSALAINWPFLDM